MSQRFLRIKEVRARVPYGRASLYRLIKAGEFPKPYPLGARAVAWLEAEIDEWIAGRVATAKPAPVARPAAEKDLEW
jgi:prophage regulatory protein